MGTVGVYKDEIIDTYINRCCSIDYIQKNFICDAPTMKKEVFFRIIFKFCSFLLSSFFRIFFYLRVGVTFFFITKQHKVIISNNDRIEDPIINPKNPPSSANKFSNVYAGFSSIK